MVRVLPVPAPASAHTGPRWASTASRCSSSSPAVSWSATIGVAFMLASHTGRGGRQTAAAPGARRPFSGVLSRLLLIPLRGMHRRRATLTSYDQRSAHRLHDVMVWLLPSAYDGAQVQQDRLRGGGHRQG